MGGTYPTHLRQLASDKLPLLELEKKLIFTPSFGPVPTFEPWIIMPGITQTTPGHHIMLLSPVIHDATGDLKRWHRKSTTPHLIPASRTPMRVVVFHDHTAKPIKDSELPALLKASGQTVPR